MSTDEEKKSRPRDYGYNPVSRRFVKKTSDTWLRLVKAGLVSEDPELLETLTAKRRETVREKNQAAVERRAKQLVAEPKPEVKQEPKPAPKKPDRAEVRRRVIQTALENQSELDGCLDDDELEERLRRLLAVENRHAKPRRATHRRDVRQFVESDEDDGTSD